MVPPSLLVMAVSSASSCISGRPKPALGEVVEHAGLATGDAVDRVGGIEAARRVEDLDVDAIVGQVAPQQDAIGPPAADVGLDGVGGGLGHEQAKVVDALVAQAGVEGSSGRDDVAGEVRGTRAGPGSRAPPPRRRSPHGHRGDRRPDRPRPPPWGRRPRPGRPRPAPGHGSTCGSGRQSRSSPSSPCTRLRMAISRPAPSESRKSTPPRSITMRRAPAARTASTSLRSRGALARSSSPTGATTVHEPRSVTCRSNSMGVCRGGGARPGTHRTLGVCSPPISPTVLADLVDDPRVVHVEHLPLAPGAHRPAWPSPSTASLWSRFGVDRLWTHQARPSTCCAPGRPWPSPPAPASGKSLCYQIPIAEAVGGTTPATALGIFPTKALAQDQLRSLTVARRPRPRCRRLRRRLHARGALLGAGQRQRRAHQPRDAPPRAAPPARAVGHVPAPARASSWSTSCTCCAACSAATSPTCCADSVGWPSTTAPVPPSCSRRPPSATRPALAAAAVRAAGRGRRSTTARPARRGRSCCGTRPASSTTGPGVPLAATSASRTRDDATTSCPTAWSDDEHPVANRPTGPTRRRSANKEAATITAQLVRHDVRTITFCRSRRGTEVVAADAARQLPRRLAEQVRPYRAGYLVAERRSIEAELFSGDAAGRGGHLGARAGHRHRRPRRLRARTASRAPSPRCGSRPVGPDAATDRRWPCSSPVTTSSTSGSWPTPTRSSRARPSRPCINADNDHVRLPHLACAAYELPLSAADHRFWGDRLDDAIRHLVLDDVLRVRPAHRLVDGGPVAVWAGRGRPGQDARASWRRPATRCASPAPTARSSAPSTPAAPCPRCTRARSTCIGAPPTG